MSGRPAWKMCEKLYRGQKERGKNGGREGRKKGRKKGTGQGREHGRGEKKLVLVQLRSIFLVFLNGPAISNSMASKIA